MAKIQLKCDAVEAEICTYIALNQLSARDAKSLRGEIGEAQEHDSTYLLNGVTMGERGVSQIVSVDLGQAVELREIA